MDNLFVQWHIKKSYKQFIAPEGKSIHVQQQLLTINTMPDRGQKEEYMVGM